MMMMIDPESDPPRPPSATKTQPWLRVFVDDTYVGSVDAAGECVNATLATPMSARHVSVLRDFSDTECQDYDGYIDRCADTLISQPLCDNTSHIHGHSNQTVC